MAEFVIVPYSKLSDCARKELIEEFITRDSCVWDGTLDEKREQILHALRTEQAVITFNTKSETADIRLTEQIKNFHNFNLSHD
ncbi:MAG: YheU family protein [Gammaproteobacteria bacterium]|nr:YheU family protein [Gammaproteobacteria bacterium]MYC24989.1 YheU family protein [Gammaproteobacteria bacterium]